MEDAHLPSNIEENADIAKDGEQLEENQNNFQRVVSPSWWSKAKLTIEPALFLIFLAANLCDVVITNLIMERICEVELHLNETECNSLGSNTEEGHRVETLVQPYASLLITGKNLIAAVLPAIMSLFLGPWSDSNGRKLLLLGPMLGLTATYSVYAGLSCIKGFRPIYFLLASLPFSLLGGYINLISAAYSYISDVSTEANRSLRLGLMESSLYIGTLVGIINSYHVFNINRNNGYVITCSAGAAISFIAFLYTIFFVRESIRRAEDSEEKRSPFQLKFVKEMFRETFKRRENHGRALIVLSLFALTTTIIVMEGEGNLAYLFTRYRFGWDLPQYTAYSAASIACHLSGLIFGCVILSKVCKVSDAALVVWSYTTKLAESVFYALVPSEYPNLMYLGPPMGLLGAVAGPSMRAVLSKIASQDVGKVFFLATAFESVLPLLSTPMFTAFYDATLTTFPGAFWLLSASFYLMDVIFTCVIYFVQRRYQGENYSAIREDDSQ